MKDHKSRKSLHKSVLKFVKCIISFLEADLLKGELTEMIL